MRIDHVDESTFVVSPASSGDQSEPFSAATRITVASGRVTKMQQYGSRADALASHPVP
jgi:hypothetical protein